MPDNREEKALAIVADALADSTDGYIAESANYDTRTRYILSDDKPRPETIRSIAALNAIAYLSRTKSLHHTVQCLTEALGDHVAAFRNPPRVKILADTRELLKDMQGAKIKGEEKKDGFLTRIRRKKTPGTPETTESG